LSLSSGGTPTSRNRLKEERLLAMNIPLPPLKEQRRIEELAAKIDIAKRLNAETAAEIGALLSSVLDRAFKGEL
ncbi:MAG: restriction endonuclease subunit S, partial [Terriglobia bacterium]